MNIFRRFIAATPLLLLAVLAAGAAPAAPGGVPARPVPPPTVEPTLPLLVDLSLEGVEKGRGGVSARLVLELGALADLGEVTIHPILPPGLAADPGGTFPERLDRLDRGSKRRFVLPIHATGPGRQPIRIEVEFDDGSGRRLRLGQGITLDPDAEPAGRLNAGAYEVMAVPIEKVGH